MKKLLIFLLLIPLSAFASTLETFFTALEGQWTSTSAESYRETTDGEILVSKGTMFEARVSRTGHTWNFDEESCWLDEGAEEASCGKSQLSYVVSGDELSLTIEGETYPVHILEMSEDSLIMIFSTGEYVFTAVISREGTTLTQNGVMEFFDGTKIYQLLELKN